MKLRIAALILLAASSAPAVAGPKDEVIDTLVKCADIADKSARSDCFDAAIPQLRAAAQPAPQAAPPAAQAEAAPAAPAQGAVASATAPGPVAAMAPPSTAEQAAEADSGGWFGSLNPFGPAPKPSAQQMAYQPIGEEILPLTIGVASYDVEPSGSFTVTLDNGQIWQEHPRDFDTPRFRSDSPNIVTIDHGMLGGYNLSLTGDSRMYKVVRVK